MGLNNAAGLAADDPAGVPLIGWHNLTTAANITSSTAQTGFPITNAANPTTHQKWKGSINTGDELITISPNSALSVDYVAVAGHNWGTLAAAITIETTASPPVTLVGPVTPTDDKPLIFRFTPQVLSAVRIRINAAEALLPEAAVIYFGKLLVLERSVTIGPQFTPMPYGRRTDVVAGVSETGNFLGRIVTGEYREGKFEFEWFTPTFYRASIDAFLAAAQENPFFWIVNPSEYPLETGFCWLTNNAEPLVDPVTRRVALTLEMRGIA